MRKYIIIALILIFGIAGLSGFCTYKKINEEQKKDLNTSAVSPSKELNAEEDNHIEENSANKLNEVEQNAEKDNKQVDKKIINNNSETKKIEKKIVEEMKENTNSITSTIPKTPTIPQSQQNETENEEVIENKIQPKVEETVAIPQEEWKVNQTKINEIISIIKNNPSSDMLEYGYNVVIDSSIVDLTSEFTFTEKRVKDKITYKFGTIKVYARDYYKNGQYITTECYLI